MPGVELVGHHQLGIVVAFTENHKMRVSSEGIFVDFARCEEHVTVVSLSLSSRRPIKCPNWNVLDHANRLLEDLRLASQVVAAVDPDIFNNLNWLFEHEDYTLKLGF